MVETEYLHEPDNITILSHKNLYTLMIKFQSFLIQAG